MPYQHWRASHTGASTSNGITARPTSALWKPSDFGQQEMRMSDREDYEDTSELARRTKTSESYWNKMRVAGDGPPYVKIGKLVRYRPSTVDTWLASLTRNSTSEADAPQAEIEQMKARQPSVT